MELKRHVFPLLNETLNYLDIGVTGKVIKIVRNKNNRFVFNISIQQFEQINNDNINLDLLNEDNLSLSNVQPGLLLGCLHPQTKKWIRCYVLSIMNNQANVALCDTGEVTQTKKLRNIPDKYKRIPVITFEAEVKCIFLHGKLRHLMENFEDYIATFEPFINNSNIEIRKKMKLTHRDSSLDFIIKKWDPQNYINTDDQNFNPLMFNNGSAVIVAKKEHYDWRHIFIRSVDKFVNICNKVQAYCDNSLNIQRYPLVGDIVAVKCVDKFYRCKIIDILDNSHFSLYLIDTGYVISAELNCLVDLSESLKKIPCTVCLVGLKDISLKPWTSEMYTYITTLFENSTTMIMEYTDYDPFGLDSVTLTTINTNEDVNGHMKELLKSVEDIQNNDISPSLNTVIDINPSIKLQSCTIVPIRVENISDLPFMMEHTESLLLPGDVVYMTGFIDFNEIYIRKVEDHNDEFEHFLDKINSLCLSAEPIKRPLVIGEIIGARSTIDNSIYRGRVIKQIDDTTCSIHYIDFGEKDNVPMSNIYDIPKDFMIPSNVIKIALQDVTTGALNADTMNYITNLLSNYEPMIIDFSSREPFKNVVLTTVAGNENVNSRLNELMKNNNSISPTKVSDQFSPENMNIQNNKVHIYENLPKLKNGDLVFITTFIDVHHIFVRKIEDENDEFYNFIDNVNSYCSAVPPIGKLPKPKDIIGAKSIDGLFYRAKVIKKINDVSYNVQFIDYGIEENVNLSDIVSLSTELIQFIPTSIMVKLKDVPFNILNKAARDYVSSISENETLIIKTIEDETNEVLLNTEKNENINDHLNMLMFRSDKEEHETNVNETDKKFKLDSEVESLEKNYTYLQPGSIVYMTAFVDLNEMYVRKLEDYNDVYHDFLDKVNAFCLSATPINRSLVIGDIIGAKSTLDDSFYRGKVLEQIDNTNYLIHFIDFGDKDKVPISNIFEIPKDFMIPSTVMKITLKGINSSSALSVKASDYISNLLSTYEPLIIDFNPTLFLEGVTLVIVSSNENVTESLNELLKDTHNTDSLKNDFVTDQIKPEVFQNMETVGLTVESDITNKLKNGDLVYITAYIDLYNIFVRKIDDDDNFQKLTERVNTYCSLGYTLESKLPELNQIVGAKSSSDGYFYRARVIQIIDDQNYNAIFIDFGCEDSVNVSDTVFLPTQLQQVTSSVFLVSLKGSSFENLSLVGHKYLEQLLLLRETLKIEFEDLSAVTLTVLNQEQNVIDYLNDLHVNETLLDNNIINDSVKPTSGMEYISNNISIPCIPPLSNKSIVIIHAFVSLKDIYISVSLNKLEVDKFLKDFSILCLTSQSNYNPAVGEVLGIRSSTDDSFYRGIVKEKLNENQFRVVLLDLGTEDVVSVNSFVEIPKQLKEVPQSIYSVGLKDVNCKHLNAQAMSYMNMLCENMPLIIEFDENSLNGLNSVTLTTVKTQQNINNHLTTLLNEKERDSPETVQTLSKGDIVYISSFVDLQNVYVRCINNNTDRFKSFVENFSSCCALERPMENEPRIGEIVAAKEKIGNKFYRAEIISKVDNEHFRVCFIDFGSRDTIHKNNIVQPTEMELQTCPPTFLVGFDELDSEPVKPIVLQYIKNISQTETFIIDSITDLFKVILISVNTQCNINKEIMKRIANSNLEPIIKNDIYANGDFDSDFEKPVIQYYKPPLEVPTQVWIAEKISSSRYSVHTYNSRIEFIRLEKLIFEDSKILKSIKSVKLNTPCIIYVSPCWYRGEILEVFDNFSAKVGLIDVGNSTVVRNVKEIYHMPSKYKGKSLLLNIDILPEPQDKLSVTSFKIIAKKHLENSTIVEVVKSVDQSYGDLENVGLPSFSSTPIHEDSEQLRFKSLNEENSSSTLCQNVETNSTHLSDNRCSNKLMLKDVQNAKWPKGSTKNLTFLCLIQDYFVMRDHLINDALTDLETKIQNYCITNTLEPYSPTENELCLAKYCDEMWYRAICIKTADSLKMDNCMVYFLDWGVEYLVHTNNIYKMSKEFVYLPATAYKCYVQDVDVLKWSDSTLNTISHQTLTPMMCEIVDKLSNDSYTIICDSIKNLDNANFLK